MSESHTMVGGAVLTGGPGICGFSLLQLYQGPHHGCQGTGSFSVTSFLVASTLLLVSDLKNRLFTLWRRCTPVGEDLCKSLTVVLNKTKKHPQQSETHLQLPAAEGVSTELPVPDE